MMHPSLKQHYHHFLLLHNRLNFHQQFVDYLDGKHSIPVLLKESRYLRHLLRHRGLAPLLRRHVVFHSFVDEHEYRRRFVILEGRRIRRRISFVMKDL